MKLIGKVLLGLTIPLLLAGSGCGVYYGIKYHDIKDQKQESNSGVINSIKELQDNITNLTKEKTQLEGSLAKIEAQLELANAENLENKDLISSLREEITALNTQITQLKNQIQFYQELLKAYEDMEKLSVTFYALDEICNIQLINVGEKLSEDKIVTPMIEGYKFLGWTKNGVDIIDDIFAEPITEDTIYIAKFASQNGTFRSIEQEIKIVVENNELVSFLKQGRDLSFTKVVNDLGENSFIIVNGDFLYLLYGYNLSNDAWNLKIEDTRTQKINNIYLTRVEE